MSVRFKELIHPNITNFSASFVIAGLLWARDFIVPPPNTLLPHFVSNLHLNGNYAWLGLICTLSIAYMLFRLLEKYTFLQQRTFLPFLIFIVLSGGYSFLHIPTNGLIGALCLILCMWQIFSAFHKSIPTREAFNAGIFLATGYFFCFEFLFLIPVLYITLHISNHLSSRVLSATTLGLAVPVAIVFGLSFWSGCLNEQTSYFMTNILFHFDKWFSNIPLIVFLGIFTIISLITITGSFQTRFNLSIPERKNQQILAWFYIFILIIMWVKLENMAHILPSFLVVCSLIFSIFFSLRSSRFSTILLGILMTFQIITLIVSYCGILI